MISNVLAMADLGHLYDPIIIARDIAIELAERLDKLPVSFDKERNVAYVTHEYDKKSSEEQLSLDLTRIDLREQRILEVRGTYMRTAKQLQKLLLVFYQPAICSDEIAALPDTMLGIIADANARINAMNDMTFEIRRGRSRNVIFAEKIGQPIRSLYS
jgi:hypothetical protein